MKSTSLLQKHPILRLLLPLMLGIVLADCFYQELANYQDFLLIITLTSFFLLLLFLWKIKGCFPFFLPLIMMGIGMLLTGKSLSKSFFVYPEGNAVYRVLITEQPEEKERSILCKSLVLERADTIQKGVRDKVFLLYLAKDSASFALGKGDSLLIYASLAPVLNSGIPDAFDYPRYLRRKGICGSAYIAADHWQLTGHDEALTNDRLTKTRNYLKERYERLGFKGDELAILTALTIGDKEELSEEIQEIYSVSGASHILAISGLHIGLLYAVLWILLSPMRKRKYLKFMSVLLIVSTLWLFAALTGFPASVVRSVTMFSLIALSSLTQERPHTLNTLASAAFVMLLFQPLWLFEIGFQMSFAAVVAIVTLNPFLSSLWPTRNKFLCRFRDLLSVSISAQIGVAPIVAFYFHRFSIYFIFSNLWAIPMVTLIMYIALLMLVFSPFYTIQQWIALLENKLIHWQNIGLEYISQLPHASIDRVWITIGEIVGFYMVIWLFYRFFQRRTAKNTLWALGSMCLLLFAHLGLSINNRMSSCIVFYNVRGCPTVHLISDTGNSWISTTDSLPNMKTLINQANPYWMHHKLEIPKMLTCENQMVDYHGKRICFINDARWRWKKSDTKLSVDYLYITSGYRGTLAELEELFDINEVVIDASLSAFYTNRLDTECNERHIPIHHLIDEGILCIPI
ncbi:MAG: ComEC/Rec2 family competence protein [Bacteroidaceae bacterium]|nr:ComEC/Rec2 family competence protein [Bacteroidaceae bacterium]